MPTKKRTQQKISPTKKTSPAVSLDNELQLDSKVRTLFGVSQNLVSEATEIKVRGTDPQKFLLFTDNAYLFDKFVDRCDFQVIQGSNYPVVKPAKDSIFIGNGTTPIIFENCEFFSTKQEPIFSIQSNSKVLFKNCVFRKPDGSHPVAGISSYISVGATSKVSVVGCWFMGTQANGSAINNAGVPANVTINGGYNTTGVTHLNTTGFGELT